MGQGIGIKADAVTACRPRHCLGVDVQLVEKIGQLIDQRNVDVALAVLNHLGRLGSRSALPR